MTDVGLNDAVKPAGTIFENETSPEKPLIPVTMIVEVLEDPAWMTRLEGPLLTVKSVTRMLIAAVRVVEPLVPVTLTK